MNLPTKAVTLDGESPLYIRVRDVLRRYASNITVDGLLASALSRSRLARSEVNRKNLGDFLHAVDDGVRVFMKAPDQPRVRRELDAIVENTDTGPTGIAAKR